MRDLNKKVDNVFEGKKPRDAHIRTFTSKIIMDISKNIQALKRLDTWAVGDGTVALFRYEDGNAYEVEVRPIQQGKYRNLWGERLKKRQERKKPEPTDEWMMTPEGVGEVPPAVNNPGNISYYKSVD